MFKRSGYLVATFLIVGACMSGCVLFDGPPQEATGNRVNDVLRAAEPGPTASVEFSEVIPGDWSRLLIVCGGNNADLGELAGFDVDEINLEGLGFLSALVFVSDTEVIDYFQIGLDDAFVDHWYFTPCSEPDDSGYSELDELQVSLDRSESKITFTYVDDRFDHWMVTSDELLALRD